MFGVVGGLDVVFNVVAVVVVVDMASDVLLDVVAIG